MLLTPEQEMIRESARTFAHKRVLPLANQLDPCKAPMPDDIRQEMAELGFFGIMIPQEYGGLGLGCLEYCLVAEELSRAWMSVGSLIARGNGFVGRHFLNDEQKARYLPRMARGDWLGALAMSEPGTGSDIAGLSTRAWRDGDDWVINGSKYWCTYADGADFLLVMARTDSNIDPKRRHRGISAFIVDKPRGGFPPGVTGSPIPKIGYFGWNTFELALDSVRVPARNMIGKEGEGFYIATNGMETARAHTAARSIGLARAALEDSIEYVRQRRQFGRAIGDFQAIRFKIGNMATEIEASRHLLYHVCRQIDAGSRCDLEASMVKLFASEMAERVTSEAIQIHGGAGYTTLFAVERHWRDARLTKIFEGTSEIQLKIISDHLLGKGAA